MPVLCVSMTNIHAGGGGLLFFLGWGGGFLSSVSFSARGVSFIQTRWRRRDRSAAANVAEMLMKASLNAPSG